MSWRRSRKGRGAAGRCETGAGAGDPRRAAAAAEADSVLSGQLHEAAAFLQMLDH